MIRADGLRKRFDQLLAVDSISFEVAPGEIYGLLGPNGAGKTTTISMISGLLPADGGSASIGAHSIETDAMKAKSILGVVPQEITLYEELSARENLRFWGRIYGLAGRELDDRIGELLERAGLSGKAKARVGTFSGGMKRRLHLLTGLIHKPKAMLLDEVTAGIDPQGRLDMLDMVREIAASGTAVLYTSHYLEEVEELCSRIGIMDHGRMLVDGTLSELIATLGEGEVVGLTGSFKKLDIAAALEARPEAKVLHLEDGQGLLSVSLRGPDVFRVLDELFGNLPGVEEFTIRKPSLQSVFIKLTGREIRD